jgi:hypothetical protein
LVGEDVENYEADEQGYHSVPLGVSWTRKRPAGRVRGILVVFLRAIASCGIGVPRNSVCDIFYMVLASRWLTGREQEKFIGMHVTLLGP